MKRKWVFSLFYLTLVISLLFFFEALHVYFGSPEELKRQYGFENLERIRSGAWHYRTLNLYFQASLAASLLYGILAFLLYKLAQK